MTTKCSRDVDTKILIEIKKKFLQELTNSGVEMSKELGEHFIPLLLVCLERSILETVKDLKDSVLDIKE